MLTVATLSADRTRHVRSLWAIPTRGDGAPTRLTRSAKGESGVAFTPGGDILFVSGRPEDAESDDDRGDEHAQLWRLPVAGGEARAVTRLPGGVAAIAAVADGSERIVVTADLLPDSDTLEDEMRGRAARRERKLGAILHEAYPVRDWDHDVGPQQPHLLALDLGDLDDAIPDPAQAAARARCHDARDGTTTERYPAELPRPLDLTPHPGHSAELAGAALTPDGLTLLASVQVPRTRAGRAAITTLDTRTGDQTMLFDEEGLHFEGPVISHAGDRIAFQRIADDTPRGPADHEIWVAAPDGSDARRIAVGWDRWPSEMRFASDDDGLIVVADEAGRAPVFRIPFDDGPVVALTDDDAAYTDLAVDPRTGAIVALRCSWVAAPHPVRIDPDGTVTPLATPAPASPAPGRLEEVQTTAGDGQRVRGWLVLPEGAAPDAPAPLLLWIHGGPLHSWNAWSWRWNPLLAAARGYAVLLPDPGLSTGYGIDFVARGWDAWGREPYTDLMAICDATEARPDIDATRTAALGGSFGGYMANWVAGHTDRFRAIVTHASLWSLAQFRGTTDRSDFWDRMFSAQGMAANSPHHRVAEMRTPMLIIHGDRDYRVPVTESIHLWSDLAAHHANPDGTTQNRFLYFPDENHWILAPQNTIVWYETVFAFLAHHVLGEDWARPAHLG